MHLGGARRQKSLWIIDLLIAKNHEEASYTHNLRFSTYDLHVRWASSWDVMSFLLKPVLQAGAVREHWHPSTFFHSHKHGPFKSGMVLYGAIQASRFVCGSCLFEQPITVTIKKWQRNHFEQFYSIFSTIATLLLEHVTVSVTLVWYFPLHGEIMNHALFDKFSYIQKDIKPGMRRLMEPIEPSSIP